MYVNIQVPWILRLYVKIQIKQLTKWKKQPTQPLFQSHAFTTLSQKQLDHNHYQKNRHHHCPSSCHPPSSTTANRGFWYVALPWSIQIASCCPITTHTLWFNTDCIGETCRNKWDTHGPLTIPTSFVRVSCLFFFRPSLCLNADSLIAMMLATFLEPSGGRMTKQLRSLVPGKKTQKSWTWESALDNKKQ